jgi:hypothetical protein
MEVLLKKAYTLNLKKFFTIPYLFFIHILVADVTMSVPALIVS